MTFNFVKTTDYYSILSLFSFDNINEIHKVKNTSSFTIGYTLVRILK